VTPRERVLTALLRKIPDRVPKTMSLCPSQLARFQRETGGTDPARYFGLEVRDVAPLHPRRSEALEPYVRDYPQGARVDEWGIGWLRGSEHHFERILHPLQGVRSVEEIVQYPLPDLAAPELFAGFGALVDSVHEEGLAAIAPCTPVGGTVFWPAYKLRGMEALMVDFMVAPELAEVLLDRVTDVSCRLAARMAGFDIDVLWLADDFGTQRALMMKPELWRKWFKKRLLAVIEAAKSINDNVIVAFHSDGKIDDIIPDLVDIGIDVLNPLQPEVMDVAAIKREYGGYLAFWGGIGTQTTLPFGSPADVRQAVTELIATVGAGGGLLAAPTHVIEPEVPWANILAFVEAVEEYGVYA